MSIKPFKIHVAQKTLDELGERLSKTRWPDEIEGAGWNYGTNLAYLKSLVEYWRNEFDWRKQEERLNRFAHFRAEEKGFGLHFIHERGKGEKPLPILLTHGWPDSFFRMIKLIPLLTDPARYGGDPGDAFDVVVPSLPGFGFSDKPSKPGFNTLDVAHLLAGLMTETLGYRRFAAHGGDWGSSITEQLALAHAEALVGIHLTDIPFWHMLSMPSEDLTKAERDYLAAGKKWQKEEGAYAMIQATRPQSLTYALNDSPAGLAAWIVEKFRCWSDCDGDIERSFSKDELLTNIMIYWVTETASSSARYYYEFMHHPPADTGKPVAVPTGVARFPKEITHAPREYAERFFNIQHWQDMAHGGHFAALEEPEALAADLRAFFRLLRHTE
jgi:microsomal epoxide hydrolase